MNESLMRQFPPHTTLSLSLFIHLLSVIYIQNQVERSLKLEEEMLLNFLPSLEFYFRLSNFCSWQC